MSGSNLRDRFLQPQRNEPEEEPDELDEQPPDPAIYQAFAKGVQGRRSEVGLMIYFPNGVTVDVIYYPYLMRVVGVSHDVISLMCTDCVYTLFGQNLQPLIPLLREQKIRYLQAYIPSRHPERAANDDTPLIEDISRVSNQQWWAQFEQRNEVRNVDEE